MVRVYGTAPYAMALLHGGPDDIGSMACVAERLSDEMGILEPLQSKNTAEALLKELRGQLGAFCDGKIMLLGHSWGAMLSILYAAKFPEDVRALFLVGCPPLEQNYVHLVGRWQQEPWNKEEQETYARTIAEPKQRIEAQKNRLMQELEQITRTSDVHDGEHQNVHQDIFPDQQIHQALREQAGRLRQEGVFEKALYRIKCPVYVIHGEFDPNPIEGVLEPMQKAGISVKLRTMQNCGHAPFGEAQAKEDFFRLVSELVQELKEEVQINP